MKNLFRLFVAILTLGLLVSCGGEEESARVIEDLTPEYFDLKIYGTDAIAVSDLVVTANTHLAITKDINPDDENIAFILDLHNSEWEYKLIFKNIDPNVGNRFENRRIGTHQESGSQLTDFYIETNTPSGTYEVSVEHNGEVTHVARQTVTIE